MVKKSFNFLMLLIWLEYHAKKDNLTADNVFQKLIEPLMYWVSVYRLAGFCLVKITLAVRCLKNKSVYDRCLICLRYAN